MALQRLTHKLSVDDFEAFISLPENIDKTFEYINGDAIEVPSNAFVSKIAAKIILFFGLYLMNHDMGHVTGEAGGYIVNGERYAPDVAYISYKRQPELARKGYNPNPPEIAVEVISDTENADELTSLRRKLFNYLTAGVTVWIVNPFDRYIEVYYPNESVQVFVDGDIITGGNILPNFEVAVSDIFPAQPHREAAPESDD